MTQSRLLGCPVDLCVLPCEQVRQLESLIRMAEARARLELVQIVTAQHAQVDVCLLVSHTYLRPFNMSAKVASTMAASQSKLDCGSCYTVYTGLTQAQFVQRACKSCWQAERPHNHVSIRLIYSTCTTASAFKRSVTFAAVHQEVIEISSESRRDVQGAAAGASCLDFRVPGGNRAGSKQVLPS